MFDDISPTKVCRNTHKYNRKLCQKIQFKLALKNIPGKMQIVNGTLKNKHLYPLFCVSVDNNFGYLISEV